ncbi:MAG: TM0106 family RecB-like putative nuclease [Chloroflexi bacterium]|nr:TM0106 family RecB-like putative nuclease [Chloroflexota bacterium]
MTNRVITSQIVTGYQECQRKAFLLLFGNDQGTRHQYVSIIERQRILNRDRQTDTIIKQGRTVKAYDDSSLGEKNAVFVDARIRVDDCEAYCDIVESPSLSCSEYRPIIVTGTYKVSEEQKLELLFAGHVLGKALNSNIQNGSIIDQGGRSHKLKLSNSQKILNPILNSLSQWMVAPPTEPPSAVLHKACPYCQFSVSCREVAEKNDDLSLLDRLTPKLIKRYHGKGIFTLKQLSFLFKPRRSRKRKSKLHEIYKPELQALAIRTSKIYLLGTPELTRHPTELFVDIEGIPDQGFHYLIGLLICSAQGNSYSSFWANTQQDEEQNFRQFLATIEKYSDAPIYHYGSYEPKAFRKLATRYKSDIDSVRKRFINLNSLIFGKIYFPVRSNRLKEIGKFIGASCVSDTIK